MSILGSVGLGGKNQYGDVKKVQQLLQRNGFPQIRDDGRIGPKTIQAIKDFQGRFMRADGIVDVNGKTYTHLFRGTAPGRPPASAAPAAPIDNHPSSGTLTVSAGQVTFDAEGKDIPNKAFFSRYIHWPGNAKSGVTLGRGYDMGERSEASVYNQLVQAGIPAHQATLLSKGAGKKGEQANQFVIHNRNSTGTISHQQQVRLFELIYPDYVQRARSNYDNWTGQYPERTQWDSLKPVIRDILVDFVYQGFTKGEPPMKAGMTNDVDTLIYYIEHSATMMSYEAGRNRAGYLKKNR
ncbi:hypothetical protein J2125_001962 [Erwinia toletana]|uniref:Peptidoglycan binding-like domain-containing protein n=1 Tax=Winslowiella toletana TaxID=92490 RepID=A0ABS4P7Z6_9GAMM|nr:peptidoglycan-binding protein [Winslowiella toletana]MBP2168770.1 hypothetical protein [Winslowiella toletana]